MPERVKPETDTLKKALRQQADGEAHDREGLPEEQQQDLVEIIRNRQRERRRDALAAAVEQARQEFARGEVRRGTVDDLMAEIAE